MDNNSYLALMGKLLDAHCENLKKIYYVNSPLWKFKENLLC